MATACMHRKNISNLNLLLFAIQNSFSASLNNNPCFITIFMTMIIHRVFRIQSHFDSKRLFFYIYHPEATPAFLCKHNLLFKAIHNRFNVRTLFFIRYQNPFRRSGDNNIMKSHSKNGDVHFIYYVDILTLIIQDSISKNRIFHCLGKSIPCSQIFPFSLKSLNLNLLLFFYYCIIKRNLGQTFISL